MLTKQDVAEVVRKMNAFYQPQAGACVATPAQMALLLDHLEAYTKKVQREVGEWGLAALSGGTAQWSLDMANWQQRIGFYRKQIEQISPSEMNTKAGCVAIYQTVVAPLLDGIYYDPLPGVSFNDAERERMVSGQGHPSTDVPTWFAEGQQTRDHPPGHSNPKPPDVATPFMLGNQVKVFQEHQRDRLIQFANDVLKEARELAKTAVTVLERVKDAADAAEENMLWVGLGLLGAGLLVGGGYVWWTSRNRGGAPRVVRVRDDDLDRRVSRLEGQRRSDEAKKTGTKKVVKKRRVGAES